MKGCLTVLFVYITGLIGVAVFGMILAIAIPNLMSATGAVPRGAPIHPFSDPVLEGILVPIVGIIAGLIVVMAVLAVVALKIFKGPATAQKGAPNLDVEQTRIVQEIYQGLSHMERRIESLETLLLDRNRDRESFFDR